MSWTIKGNGTGEDLLYSQAGTPSLDLRFASTKSLNDYVSGNNLITFTRASSGTYVDSTGVLRTATTNLSLRSQEFENAAWVKGGLTVTANQEIAPDGSLTADTCTLTASGHALYRFATVTQSTTYTFSFYAKRGTGTTAVYSVTNDSAGGTSIVANTSYYAQTSSSTWTRIVVTFTTPAGCTSIGVFLQRDSGSSSGTMFYWGAQLEQSSTVGEYIPTTSTINSAPRFDHNPQTGESLGLLVEEARTNLFLNSEDFSNPTWTLGAVTVTANAVTSPTGAATADSLLETTTNTEHLAYATSTITFTTATHSIYVKPNGRTNVALRFYHTVNDWVATVFNLTGNGSVTQSSAGSSSGFSAVSRSIVNAGNGWYRISMTATQASRAVYISAPDLCTSSTPTLAAGNGSEVYAGDVTKGVYVWGAQLEVGAFPTSYIPTTSATVTRAADAASITGSNFSSWYNQTEGTVYHQGRTPTTANFFSIDDGTANNRITSYMTSATAPFFFVATGGTAQVNITSSAIAAASLFAQADAYRAADFAISTNGGTASTISTGTVPVANKMVIGANVGGAAAVNGTIRRLTYWPTRLSNTTLQTITL